MAYPFREPIDLDVLREEVVLHASSKDASGAAYEALASYIDASSDAGSQKALKEALKLSDIIEEQCEPMFACLVRYCRSNIWASLHALRRNEDNAWSWDQPELLQQLHWLRAAVQHEGFTKLPKVAMAQIYCNLGNTLSSAGRFVDALVEWRHALYAIPKHGMARGNLGSGLIHYSRALYDDGHKALFLQYARDELRKAAGTKIGQDGATYPEALEGFARELAGLTAFLHSADLDGTIAIPNYPLGRSKSERKYREWVLQRRLFLNPLNDLYTRSIAAQDILMLPSHQVQGAGITYLAFYNQLKQEFAFARWNLFDGTKASETHLADRNVHLSFNADFAQYSTALEQVKSAYRCAYSLFDKIAYFIKQYWQLGIPEHKVSFRSVWLEPPKKNLAPQVRPVFETSQNLPLRGLFWLSKDLYDESLRDVAQPNAKNLDKLRNHLEHKYVKVVDSLAKVAPETEPFVDQLAYKVEREDFEQKTERLLQLARSALIYLSLAMHVEERRMENVNSMAVPLHVGTYPDSLKR